MLERNENLDFLIATNLLTGDSYAWSQATQAVSHWVEINHNNAENVDS